MIEERFSAIEHGFFEWNSFFFWGEMQKTIFYTPVISHAMHYIARGILFVLGWTCIANPQFVSKYVVIAEPHTSNWDFFYTMLVAFALELKVYAMGKKSLTEG